jgi:hypothetical protein
VSEIDEAALIKLILSILDDYTHKDAHASLKKDVEDLESENKKMTWLLITSLAAAVVDLLKNGLPHVG